MLNVVVVVVVCFVVVFLGGEGMGTCQHFRVSKHILKIQK